MSRLDHQSYSIKERKSYKTFLRTFFSFFLYPMITEPLTTRLKNEERTTSTNNVILTTIIFLSHEIFTTIIYLSPTKNVLP